MPPRRALATALVCILAATAGLLGWGLGRIGGGHSGGEALATPAPNGPRNSVDAGTPQPPAADDSYGGTTTAASADTVGQGQPSLDPGTPTSIAGEPASNGARPTDLPAPVAAQPVALWRSTKEPVIVSTAGTVTGDTRLSYESLPDLGSGELKLVLLTSFRGEGAKAEYRVIPMPLSSCTDAAGQLDCAPLITALYLQTQLVEKSKLTGMGPVGVCVGRDESGQGRPVILLSNPAIVPCEFR